MEKVKAVHGVGSLELLQLLFIGLKLGDIIQWSWWWVFSPTLIPLGLIGILLILYFIYNGVR